MNCEHKAAMTETFVNHDWCGDCGAIRTKSAQTGEYGEWNIPTTHIYTKKDLETLIEIQRQVIMNHFSLRPSLRTDKEI